MTWQGKRAPILLAWLICAGLLLAQTAAGQEKDAKREVVAKLQGTWRVLASDIDGKFAKSAEPYWTMTFDGLSVVQRDADKKVIQKGKWKIVEVERKYVKVNYDLTEGPNKGETLVGIIKLDRDELKFSYRFASSAAGRPDEFATKKGDGVSMYIFKRHRR